MIIVGERPSYHHKIKIIGNVSNACSGIATGNIIAYNTINGNKIQITDATPFSFNYEFLGAAIDQNPPTIVATAGTYDFNTIKGFTYDTTVTGSDFATVSNTNDVTSSWYNYEMYFDDKVDEEGNKIPVSTYNGLILDPETGNISGSGAEYSDYRTSGEIKVTYYYIKNGVEYNISTVKPISILVGAYLALSISGGADSTSPNNFPTMFIADENDKTVLTSIRNTETSCLNIKFEQNTNVEIIKDRTS